MKLFHFNFSDFSKYYDLVCDEYFKIILIVDFEHFTRELRVSDWWVEQLYTVINKRQTFIKWENIVERECKNFKDSTIRSVIFLTKLFSMALWQIDYQQSLFCLVHCAWRERTTRIKLPRKILGRGVRSTLSRSRIPLRLHIKRNRCNAKNINHGSKFLA